MSRTVHVPVTLPPGADILVIGATVLTAAVAAALGGHQYGDLAGALAVQAAICFVAYGHLYGGGP